MKPGRGGLLCGADGAHEKKVILSLIVIKSHIMKANDLSAIRHIERKAWTVYAVLILLTVIACML